MDVEKKEGQNNEQPTTDDDQNQPLSNADLKAHPWVQELIKRANRANELEQAEKARADAEIEAKQQAEIEKAKAEERFEDALRLEREKAEASIREARDQALRAQMRASIAENGGRITDGLISVAMAEYDSEKHGTIDTFVETLKSNESYAGFFGKIEQPKPSPPGKLPVSGVVSALTRDQIRQMEQSGDPQQRAQAIEYKKQWYDKHGSFDGLL